MTDGKALWLAPSVFTITSNSRVLFKTVERLSNNSQKELAQHVKHILNEEC
jgi:hypothetical protein